MLHIGLQHLLHRRNVESIEGASHESPGTVFRNTVLDRLMYGVAIVAPTVLLPQVFELYVAKDAHGLSLITWGLLALINGLWVTYARAHHEKPVFISSLLSGLIEVFIVIGIFLYR